MSYVEPVCVSITLSDLVIREQGTGKLSLIGTFTHFNADEFPFSAPPFCITSLITNVGAAAFPLNVEVRIEDSDGGEALSGAGGQVGLRTNASHQPDDVVELPIQIAGCPFPRPGSFRITVWVDDEQIGFRIIKVRNAADGRDQ
jgi:hypothetical protein